MTINPHIFKRDDIRGVFGEDFDEKSSEVIGRAFGTWVKQKGGKSVVLGRDNRLSSDKIHGPFIKGATSAGVNIMDVGIAPTPMVYQMPALLKQEAACVITASHNPAEWNGFKFVFGDRTVFGDEIGEIKELCSRKSARSAKGKVTEVPNAAEMYEKVLLDSLKEVRKEGKIKRKVRVVVDSANGLGGLFAPRILEKIGCEVIDLHSRLDGTFPNHHPDPMIGSNMHEVIMQVKSKKADLGIGFDVDLDRINVCDEKGFILWGDGLLMFFARRILEEHPHSQILYNTQCSPAAAEDISSHGGIPIMVPTGHSLVLNELRFYQALFAGEYKGHMFFADHFSGFDDALYAAMRLVDEVSELDNIPLSEFMSDVPYYRGTGEIIISCPDDKKFKVVEKVKEEMRRTHYVDELDGARIRFSDGFEDTWGLVRASNTFPKVQIFAWAPDNKALEKARGFMVESVNRYL